MIKKNLFRNKKVRFFGLGFLLLLAGMIIFQNCGDVHLRSQDLDSLSTTTSISTSTSTSTPTSTTISSTTTTVGAGSTTMGPTTTIDVYSPLPTPTPVLQQPPSGGSYCNGASFYSSYPPGVVSPIIYNGNSYNLFVIGSAYNGDCTSTTLAQLDPLLITQRLDIRFYTRKGIYALRFRTPNLTAAYYFTFLVFAGNTQAEYGARFSISRLPGEFFDDGRAPSTSYCDFGNNNNSFSMVANVIKPAYRGCQLLPNTYYYYNALVLNPDSSSGLVNNSSYSSLGSPVDCLNNPVFPYCSYVP